MAHDQATIERRESIFNALADICYGLSLASIGASLALMVRARNFSGEERACMERSSLFVGQWPPTFAIFGRIFAAQTSKPELPFAPQRPEPAYGGRLADVH